MSPDPSTAPGLKLRLYLAGDSPNSVAALANLRSVLAEAGCEQAAVEVIDVLINPEVGLRDGLVVTPTLVKVTPLPERRIIGSLKDRPAVLRALGLVIPA